MGIYVETLFGLFVFVVMMSAFVLAFVSTLKTFRFDVGLKAFVVVFIAMLVLGVLTPSAVGGRLVEMAAPMVVGAVYVGVFVPYLLSDTIDIVDSLQALRRHAVGGFVACVMFEIVVHITAATGTLRVAESFSWLDVVAYAIGAATAVTGLVAMERLVMEYRFEMFDHPARMAARK